MLRERGFQPMKGVQSRSRIEGKGEFTRHMVRLRHTDFLRPSLTHEELPEPVLTTSHDGTAAYRFNSGIYRLVCENGLLVASADFGGISVKHSGRADFNGRVIDATYEIMSDAPRTLDTIRQWKQITLSRPQQLPMAEAAMEIKPNAAIRPAHLLTARREEDMTAPDASRDLWRTTNVLQESLIRGGIQGPTPGAAASRPARSRRWRLTSAPIVPSGIWPKRWPSGLNGTGGGSAAPIFPSKIDSANLLPDSPGVEAGPLGLHPPLDRGRLTTHWSIPMPPTGELARIDDELRRAYDGDCWHGPHLRAALEAVTAEAAATRHPPLVHSVWAMVNHLAAWVEVVAIRITERREAVEPEAGDFPPVTDTSEEAWSAALDDLDRQHKKLLGVVADLDAARLDEIVPGKPYPIAVMLHGTAQHYAYHAGQIALHKKLSAR